MYPKPPNQIVYLDFTLNDAPASVVGSKRMKILTYCIAFFCIIKLTSCSIIESTQTLDGITYLRYSNRSGELLNEITLDSSNGRFISETKFKRGTSKIKYIFVYDNANGFYSKITIDSLGHINGPSWVFYSSGDIYQTGFFSYTIGYVVRNLDSTSHGYIVDTCNYYKSIEVGNWKSYYQNGKLMTKGNYLNYFHEYSSPVYEISDEMPIYIVTTTTPVKNGKFKFFNAEGKLVSVEYWDNGQLNSIKFLE